MTEAAAYLGVERSLTGRRWIGPTAAHDRLAEAMAQSTDLPRPVCQTLARLGVPPDQAQAYLEPKLRDLLPNPSTLRDMDKAAARFLKAVQDREAIAIFADYDVDGGASAALLLSWLRAMGRDATLYVPDRIDEGYG
ncbi:MAG: single-stranded-DNA-specific exonuclease RecJ, partial [Litoreibacter sp.]|nr:single-stranded-DNA-specific exonuclease RecJ [Litoreibacter sp.]